MLPSAIWPAWYKAAEDGGQKRARTRLKKLSLVMPREQMSTAIGKAASVPRSPSEMDEAESSIGRPFGDIPMDRVDIRGKLSLCERMAVLVQRIQDEKYPETFDRLVAESNDLILVKDDRIHPNHKTDPPPQSSLGLEKRT